MEFPKRDQVTFKNLNDVRLTLDLTIGGLKAVSEVNAHLIKLGAPLNCRSVVQNRAEARALSVLILSLLENLKRLHPAQCETPETCTLQNLDDMRAYTEMVESECIRVIRNIDEQSMKVELAGGVIDDPEIEFIDLSHLN